MSLSLTQSATAVSAYAIASFLGINGTEPYIYSVLPDGAGGTINATTGAYTAPNQASSDPRRAYDTIQVEDGDAATATAQILVGTPLLLVWDIFKHELGLDDDHIYLWDQKIMQPKDSGLYVAISVPICKPIGNVNEISSVVSGMSQGQFVSMQAMVDIDVISRGPAARDQKESVLLAVQSVYSQQQQQANGFYLAPMSGRGGFVNLSFVDGAAIPYRYRISLAMQYAYQYSQPSQYFDTFQGPDFYTDD